MHEKQSRERTVSDKQRLRKLLSGYPPLLEILRIFFSKRKPRSTYIQKEYSRIINVGWVMD
jgi:hypothetical protein